MKKISLAIEPPEPLNIPRYLWKQCIIIHQVVLMTSCDPQGFPDCTKDLGHSLQG